MPTRNTPPCSLSGRRVPLAVEMRVSPQPNQSNDIQYVPDARPSAMTRVHLWQDSIPGVAVILSACTGFHGERTIDIKTNRLVIGSVG